MLIVDAQIHIWKNHKPTNPNHRQVTDYTAADVLKEMDEGGVNAALIHPPGWDPDSNALAVEAARQHPNRLAILGNFPLDRPESRTMVDSIKSRPGMLGLRFALLQPHQQTWLTDGTLDWLWAAAERAGLPVALLGPGLLQVIGSIAERHPGLKLIIDHFGRPDAAWSNLPQLVAAAKHRNVALKATGAPSYSSEAYPYRDIHGHIRALYDAYGPETDVLGHRHHAHALLVAAVRDHVHGGTAVAVGQGQGTDHGTRRVHLARLEAAGIATSGSASSARTPSRRRRRGLAARLQARRAASVGNLRPDSLSNR